MAEVVQIVSKRVGRDGMIIIALKVFIFFVNSYAQLNDDKKLPF